MSFFTKFGVSSVVYYVFSCVFPVIGAADKFEEVDESGYGDKKSAPMGQNDDNTGWARCFGKVTRAEDDIGLLICDARVESERTVTVRFGKNRVTMMSSNIRRVLSAQRLRALDNNHVLWNSITTS